MIVSLLDDPRYVHLPKCDVTPGGEFILASSDMTNRWKSKVLYSAKQCRMGSVPHGRPCTPAEPDYRRRPYRLGSAAT